eukprot:4173241-Ditylum_brightwellii.AAC.1
MKLLYYTAVLQSGQEKGSALAPNTARLPPEAPPQQPTLPCPTKHTATSRFQKRLLRQRQSPPKANAKPPSSDSKTLPLKTSQPVTVPKHSLQTPNHPQR